MIIVNRSQQEDQMHESHQRLHSNRPASQYRENMEPLNNESLQRLHTYSDNTIEPQSNDSHQRLQPCKENSEPQNTSRLQKSPSPRPAPQYKAAPSYTYHSKLKSYWRSVLFRHSFEDDTLEHLYRIFVYKLQLSSLKCLVVIAIIMTTLLCVLNFVFVSGITIQNICYIVLCVLFVCILIFLHTKFIKVTRLQITSLLVLVLYICVAVVSLPINYSSRPYQHYGPADGLWVTLVVVWLVYVLLPLRVYVCLVAGVLLSAAHTTVAIFLTETHEWLLWRQYVCLVAGVLLSAAHTTVAIFLTETHEWLLWRQITANLLLLVFVHCLGLWLYDKTEHAHRKVFSECRGCVAARIEAEEESDKLERLLSSMLPYTIAKEVKRDLVSVDHHQDSPLRPHVTAIENVSLLYGNIIGLTELSCQCTASELVKILNQIFAKFDALAVDNHCVRYKILGDVYFCTCGLPDARPDHAKCCVDLARDIIDVLREIREATELELYTKIGIHTGAVTCGIVGTQRWGFDVFGHDVQLGKEVMLACLPGKVLISKSTFEYLQGEYDVEPANVWSRSQYLRDRKTETYYVVPGARRRLLCNFPPVNQSLRQNNRHSYCNMSSVLATLHEGLVPGAEVPFLPISQGPEVEKLEKELQNQGDQINSRSVNSLYIDKVQRYLTQSVLSRAIEKNKSDWVNFFTLRYHHKYKEKRYHKQEDQSFSTTMLCSMVLLVLVAATQAIVLPRTLLLLLLFLLCFTWISAVLIVFLAAKLRVRSNRKCIDFELQKSLAVRMTLMVVTVLFIYSIGQINVLCCRGGLIFPFSNETMDGILSFNRDYHLSCEMPHYVYLSGAMAILVTTLFIKMAAWVKLVLTVVMALGYALVLEVTHPKIFKIQDIKTHPDLPLHIQGLLLLVLLTVSVYVQGRLIEWVLRLAFLWRDQARDERIAVTEFQNHVRQVVMNCLPSHVATHFVDFTGLKHSLDYYGHSYSRVGVCCTSVPNFLEHFRGNVTLGNVNANNNNNNNNHIRGIEAFKVLNELVTIFDELLKEDRFGDIDKIRSFGHGYQITVGLVPERPMLESMESMSHHVTLLVEFVHAMKDKIHNFNTEKGLDLKLRSGVAVGPITLGVIGARRPLFDVWGFTMYLANLMEASGKEGFIQVTEDVIQPLAGRYELQPRGPVYLNGRGELNTYFITGRKFVHMPPPAQAPYTPANMPLRKQQEHWKRLSHESPLARIKPSLTERVHDAMGITPYLVEGCSHDATGMQPLLSERSHDSLSGGLRTSATSDRLYSHPVGRGLGGSHGGAGERSCESFHSLQNAPVPERPMGGVYIAESPMSQRSLNTASMTCIQRQNSNDSNTSVFGIRIPSLQRNRMPSSEDSPKTSIKAMMTPPSSLSRKRKDSAGTLPGLMRQNSGAGGLLAPPPDPNQGRMASPDLPAVHYQRGPGTNGNQDCASFSKNTLTLTQNTLTQSQILNPEGGSPENSSENLQSTRNLQGSPHSNNSGNNAVIQRRSSTQTPSSNRSSAETIGSVISVHVLDSPNNLSNGESSYKNSSNGDSGYKHLNNGEVFYNTPPRGKAIASPIGNSCSFVGNLPKIEESNRESRSFSSRDSLLDNGDNKSRSNRTSRDMEITGSEMAEMDNILRELGVAANKNNKPGYQVNNSQSGSHIRYSNSSEIVNGASVINNNNIRTPSSASHPLNNLNISSPPKHKAYQQTHILPPMLRNVHDSSSGDENKTKTMSSEHGSTQISEYENDDLVQPSQPVNAIQVKNAPKISLLQKRNSLPDNKSVNVSGSKAAHRGGSLPKEADHTLTGDTQSMGTQTHLTSPQVPRPPVRDYVYRQYSKHMASGNDDSDSTCSSVYGIPKMRGGRVRVDPPEEDSPPPLPPPPSQAAMTSLENRINQSQEPTKLPHPLPHQHHVQHLPPQYRQPLFANSAFRPVAPQQRQHPLHHGNSYIPVMRGPNMGFVGVRQPYPVRVTGVRPALTHNQRHHYVRNNNYYGLHGPPSSNTSEAEENANPQPVSLIPRRKPTKQNNNNNAGAVTHGLHKSSSGSSTSTAANNNAAKQGTDRNKNGKNDTKNNQQKKSPANNNGKNNNGSSARSSKLPVTTSKAAGQDKERHHSEGCGKTLDESTDDTIENEEADASGKKPRPPAPPFQIKRRQVHQHPIRKCRSLDYIPSDLEDTGSVSGSRAESPACDYSTTGKTQHPAMPITQLIKNHIIGPDNVSLSSLESGSEMSRSEPDLNYDSSTTAYESEYDNYRPGMASDEEFFVPEPISDVELGLFDDINLEDVTVSDQYNIDIADFINKNNNSKKQVTDV